MSKTFLNRQSVPIITSHARERFCERFPCLDESLENLLSESVLFGGQKGNDYMLLNSKHGLIFPMTIDEKSGRPVVKTVLTQDQGFANLSLKMRIVPAPRVVDHVALAESYARQAELERMREQEQKQEQEKELEQKQCEVREEMLRVAREHAIACRYRYPEKDTQKVIIKELREEYGFTRKSIDKIYWPEFGRLVYDHNAQLGLVAGNAC